MESQKTSEYSKELFQQSVLYFFNLWNFAELRVCLVQFAAKDNLSESLNHLNEMIVKAVNSHRPDIICLPELFNFPYCTDLEVLQAMAETTTDGVTFRQLSLLSKKFSVYIVGGIVERDGPNLYNTAAALIPMVN